MSDERASPSSTSTEESNNSEATNVGQLFGQNSENLEALGPIHPHDVIDTDMAVGSTFQVERVNSGIKVTPDNTPSRSPTTPLTMGQGNLPPYRLPPNYSPPILESITRGAIVHNNPLYVPTSFTRSWPLPGITPMNLPQGLTNSTSTMTSNDWAMYELPTGYSNYSNMCNKTIYAHTQIPQSGHTQLEYLQSRLSLSGYHQSRYLPMYVTGAMVSTPHGVSIGAGARSNRPLTSVLPTQAMASIPHIVLTGAGSELIFQGMPSQISAGKTSPNNAIESFPVFRQQMEESHRDIVNMLTEQMTIILNPMIENNSAKIEQVARQVNELVGAINRPSTY
ncbi:hypothetical protein PIB30_040959 [Stylosanthes scabra]|uniref:Uncharacterized protein n=1 Tax=Stylosanthes scabra TaxID=79078 RepID=A0ABU6SFU1_9FABA|nr:hypothetical protein [Stylosanthes scabra]